MKIGVLHPGEMGISVAAAAQQGGAAVYWVSEGRGEATRARAERFGLADAGTLARLCGECKLIISVCPPHAAEATAIEVAGCRFSGLYLDANAVSPERARRIAETVTAAGAAYVDGGIIGGPAWEAGRTRLYVSGARAEEVAACFVAGPLEACVLGERAGDASALKMCYAALTKGTTALLCAILATAERLEVRGALEQQWDHDQANSAARNRQRARAVTAKAWRFEGEMEEIAATFQAAGLPGGFHQAAAEVYRRLAEFKDAPATPELEAVLAALLPKALG